MSLAVRQQGSGQLVLRSSLLRDYIPSLVNLLSQIKDDTEGIERLLLPNRHSDILVLRDIQVELTRMRRAAEKRTSDEHAYILNKDMAQAEEAIEYCVRVLKPASEKTLILKGQLQNSDVESENSLILQQFESTFKQYLDKMNRATSNLREMLDQVIRTPDSDVTNGPELAAIQSDQQTRSVAAADAPFLSKSPDKDVYNSGIQLDSDATNTRRRTYRARLLDRPPDPERTIPIMLPYSPISGPHLRTESPKPEAESSSTPNPRTPVIETCWILILLGFTTILGSSAVGIYYSLAEDKMGDGFTLAAWMVAAGAFALGIPSTYHRQHCLCWNREGGGHNKTCWLFIFCSVLIVVSSGSIGIYFSVAKNQLGGGFTAAAFVVAVGAACLAAPFAYHYPHCKCWSSRGYVSSFKMKRRVRTMCF